MSLRVRKPSPNLLARHKLDILSFSQTVRYWGETIMSREITSESFISIYLNYGSLWYILYLQLLFFTQTMLLDEQNTTFRPFKMGLCLKWEGCWSFMLIFQHYSIISPKVLVILFNSSKMWPQYQDTVNMHAM